MYLYYKYNKNLVKWPLRWWTLTHGTEKHRQSFKLNHCVSAERQRGNDLLVKSNAALSVCRGVDVYAGESTLKKKQKNKTKRPTGKERSKIDLFISPNISVEGQLTQWCSFKSTNFTINTLMYNSEMYSLLLIHYNVFVCFKNVH